MITIFGNTITIFDHMVDNCFNIVPSMFRHDSVSVYTFEDILLTKTFIFLKSKNIVSFFWSLRNLQNQQINFHRSLLDSQEMNTMLALVFKDASKSH